MTEANGDFDTSGPGNDASQDAMSEPLTPTTTFIVNGA
jgi:hypothetical protein